MPTCFLPTCLAARISKLSAVLAFAAALCAAPGHAAPPRFDSATQRLTLPLVQLGENVYPNVEIELGRDGIWTLLKAGEARALQDGEVAGAAIDAAAGTLTVARLHLGGKVYNNVELGLAGNSWNLKGTPQTMSALTEDDFTGDTELEATLDHIVMLNLESPGTTADATDSGGNGTDSFPLRLQAGDYQFCFEKQDDGADTLNLRDEQGNLLLTLKSGDPCAQLTLATGRYMSEVRYGGTSGQAHPVFVRKQQPGGQGFAFDFGNAIIVAFGADCKNCDLTGALYLGFPGWRRNLSNSYMNRITFKDANLEEANLSSSLLIGAGFSHTNLKNANLSGAVIEKASIANSNLSGANLRGVSFKQTHLTNVDLSNANLREVRFLSAILSNVNLSGADLSGAFMGNRIPCAEGSIGVCK